ncbi:MAG: aminotransferase class I/II-fold pyridoxal phosphate-dependent enzyme [Ruminococcaceae bacterium]|nr:aminotransferase class I/II-fold pyridoxal phosphate-dependent enzyme [Oscillospiraceae bacterium]
MQRSKESKRIWLSTPTMHGNEMQYIEEAFEKNWVAPLGFNVDAFEKEAAAYLDENVHTLALNAGTAALHLAVKLAGVKRGDRVFCTDMTFAATINPAVYEGAVPVFVDAERDTWNMDPRALEKAFEKYPDTKVVILAHLYGTPSKMDEITAICNKHGAVLIEDAAEAFAAEYRGKKMGTFGKYAALSFNGNKIITTSGGGMLITDTEDAKKKAFFWATQARDNAPWYQHSEIGYNYRMSNIVAGIGRGQMVYLDEHRGLKEKIYRRYEEAFKDIPVKMNPYLDYTKPNFWLSCITIDAEAMDKCDPSKLRETLDALNIESRPIWKPMHMQPVYAECDMICAGDNVGEDIFARGLCLPSDIKMTEEEQDAVIDAIKSCF